MTLITICHDVIYLCLLEWGCLSSSLLCSPRWPHELVDRSLIHGCPLEGQLAGGQPGLRGALGWRLCALEERGLDSWLLANPRAPRGMFSCLSLMA